MFRRILPSCLMLLLLLTLPGAEAKKKKGIEDSLSGKFEEISKAEMAMKEVSFSPGAPAVILFEGERLYFDQPASGAPVTRTIYQRRIKILDEGGVEGYGDFIRMFNRDAEDMVVRARTVLPDGAVIDAADNIHRDRSKTGQQIVSIAFPQVQVGAILEVIILWNIEAIYEISWEVQARIPVLQSLLIYSPPKELRVSQADVLMSEEEARPAIVDTARGKSMVWHIKNQNAIPTEANQPPFIELAKTIYVLPVAWRGDGYNYEFATDWRKWNKEMSELLDNWMRTRRASCKQLAKDVTEGMEGALDKAEALRQELRKRTRALVYSSQPMRQSPDETLANSSGTSADIAGTMVAMLRAVDLDADLVAIRHRDDGLMPEAFPMPILFNDMIVRLRADGMTLFFSPVAELPVWKLPGFARGVVAMPLDVKSTAPVRLPELAAEDNKATREATLEISATGEMHVSSVHTYQGILAEYWRKTLRDETAEERQGLVQDRLRRWAPGARLESVQIENLLDVDQNLVVRCEFAVDGYVTIAGKRWFINPNLFSRVSTEDWSAQSRETMVDLGGAFERLDTISLRLPAGVAEITAPQPSDFNAGEAGFYMSSVAQQGNTLIAKRHVKHNIYRFSQEQFPGLKAWFGDMAAQDDQPIVLRLQ